MRASSTSAADRLRGRAIEASCARSASSNINCAFGRPVTIGYLHVTRYPKCKQTLCYEFMGHHTSAERTLPSLLAAAGLHQRALEVAGRACATYQSFSGRVLAY